MSNVSKFLLFFINLFFFGYAFADPEIVISLGIDQQDNSTIYLGEVFGKVGNVLSGSGNNLLANMFQVFNNTVLVLGSTVLGWTTITSAIHTASDGQVMGQNKGSAALTPLKSTAAVGLLLPVGNGYSVIQVIVMYIVLKGVVVANAVWEISLDFVASQGAINSLPAVEESGNSIAKLSGNSKIFAQNLLKTSSCMHYYKTIEKKNTACVKTGAKNETLHCGIVDSPILNERKICGTFTAASAPVSSGADELVNAQIAGTLSAIGTVARAGEESVLQIPGTKQLVATNPNFINAFWRSSSLLKSAVSSYKSSMSSLNISADSSRDSVLSQAKKAGWLFAGSYYFKLTDASSTSAAASTLFPSYAKGNPPTAIGTALDTISEKYLSHASPRRSSAMTAPVSGSAGGGLGAKILSLGLGELTGSIANSMFNAIKTNGDPIIAIQKLGFEMMLGIEMAISTVLLILVAASAFAACSASNPFWVTLLSTVLTVLPPLAVGFFFVWTAGASLAIYLPLKPYIVYMFAAVGWIIAVIEAMVASPIVALGLAAPSNDNLGKAAPAVLLIANVFLRPALMVIGFVAATKLFTSVARMLAYTFRPTVEAQIYANSDMGIGIFAPILLFTIYTALLTAMVDMCFALIYSLADKIMSWIGGRAVQSTAGQSERQVHQGFQKGEQTASQTAQGSASSLSKGGQQLRKHQQEKQKAAAKAKKQEEARKKEEAQKQQQTTPSGKGGGSGGGSAGGGSAPSGRSGAS